MVLGQFFCRFTGSAAQTHCARRPQLVSKKFLEKEIFAGTNFRELAFDRENRENVCLAKISRYTVSDTEKLITTCHAFSTSHLQVSKKGLFRTK